MSKNREGFVQYLLIIIGFGISYLTLGWEADQKVLWQATKVIGVYPIQDLLLYTHGQLATFILFFNLQYLHLFGLNLWVVSSFAIYVASYFYLRKAFNELGLNVWLLTLLYLNPVVYQYVVWPFYSGVSMLGIALFVYGSVRSFSRNRPDRYLVLGILLFALFNLKVNFVTVVLFIVPMVLFRSRLNLTFRNILLFGFLVSLPSVFQLVKNEIAFDRPVFSSWSKFNAGRASCPNDMVGFSMITDEALACGANCEYREIEWLHNFRWNHHRIFDVGDGINVLDCFEMAHKMKHILVSAISTTLYDPLDYDLVLTEHPTINLYNLIPLHFNWDTYQLTTADYIIQREPGLKVGRLNVFGLVVFAMATFYLLLKTKLNEIHWFLGLIMLANCGFFILIDGQEGQRMLFPYYPIIWFILAAAFHQMVSKTKKFETNDK